MIELDDEVRFILGRPNFTLAGIARRLHELGIYEVKTKAEDEQAVAIHWMLTLYEKYGKEWRNKLDEAMNEKESQSREGGEN